jgi:hypothetical protein
VSELRELQATSRFAGDDGSADPELAALLADFACGRVDLPVVVAALAGARVLVPVLAGHELDRDAAAARSAGTVAGLPTGDAADGLPDPDAETGTTGVVAVASGDGRRAFPVFTSLAAMTAWRPTARPLLAEMARAALVAVNQGWALVALDPAGPVPVTVPRPAVWSIAAGRSWRPAVVGGTVDPEVVAAITLAAEPVAHVRRADAVPGRTAEVAVVLGIDAGLDRAGLDAVLRQVNARLAASDVIAERVDAIELRVGAAR